MRERKWAIRIRTAGTLVEVYLADDNSSVYDAISSAVLQYGQKHRSQPIHGELELQITANAISTGDD